MDTIIPTRSRCFRTKVTQLLFCLFAWLSSLPVMAQIDVTKAVGTTPGSVGVSENGAANVSIPILVPTGINGMKPDLALVYNSLTGHGIIANGWSISGLSSITRAGKTNYYNDITSPVTYNNVNDAFCLNGQRMFAITGSNGANGTVYGLENESFSKIESFGGTATTGPEWFKVTTKDGTVMEFGNNTNSRVAGNLTSSPYIGWYINKVTDKSGNYMTFTYSRFNNWTSNIVISEINYTGNDAAGVAPTNKVTFQYGARVDPVTSYNAGVSLEDRGRLQGVLVTSNGGIYRFYHFEFENGPPQTKLASITEVGNDGTTQFNPLKFEYGNNASTENVRILPDFTFLPSGDCVTGDFDGDGKTDILAASYYYDNNGIKNHTAINIYKDFNGFGSTGAVSMIYRQTLPQTGKEVNGVKQNSTYNFMAQDYDNDGKDDVVLTESTVEGSGSTAKRVFSNITINHTRLYNAASGWTFYPKVFSQVPTIPGYTAPSKYINKTGQFFFQGDFDGDGNQDYILLLGINADNSYAAFFSSPAKGIINQQILNFGFGTNTGTFFATTVATADNVQAIDFNGDGTTELLVTKDAQSYVLSVFPVSAATGYNYAASVLYTTTSIAKGYRAFPGDFNGDGKTDFLVRNSATTSSGTWSVLLSTGVAYVTGPTVPFINAPILSGDNGYSVAHTLTVGDFNHDGKSDIVHALDLSGSSSNYNVYLSNGNAFTSEVLNKSQSVNSSSAISGDFNGDGKTDIVNLNGQTGKIISIRPMLNDRVLSKMTNSLGAVTTFTYNTLTNTIGPAVYATNWNYYYGDPNEITTGNYVNPRPFCVTQSPFFVVSDLYTPDGVGGNTDLRYEYQDAMLSKSARGYLGFRTVISRNSSSGITTTTLSDVNSTFILPYMTKQSTTQDGVALSDVTPVVSFVAQSSSFFDKRYFLRNDKTTSLDYLNKAGTEESSTFDNYGNVTASTTRRGYISGSTVSPVETVTKAITYGQYNTPVPSLPTNIVVTRLRQGAPSSVTETKTNTYNAKGLPETHVDFSGKAKAITSTWTYDLMGNVVQSSVAAQGLATRIEKSTYDAQGRFVIKKEYVGGSSTKTESYTYDKYLGTPLTTTSSDGLTTTMAYDPLGRLIKTTVPEGFDITQTMKWETSDGVYSITSEQPGGGPNVKAWYDVLGREVKSQTLGFNNNWLTATTKYDERGNVVADVKPYYGDETPVTTSYAYDSYNRLKSTSNPSGSIAYSYSTNASGQTSVIATSSGGKSSTQTSDATDKVMSITDGGGTITYTYDSWGQKLGTSHGSVTLVSTTYDEYGRQTQQTDANAGTTTYEYDAFGQLIKQVRNNKTYTMLYDAFGRTTSRTTPEGTTTYEYFTGTGGLMNDKLTKIIAPNGVVEAYEYDNLSRLKKANKTIDGLVYSYSYEYDSYGNASKTTFPSGLVVNHNHDRNGITTSTTLASGASLFTATSMNSAGIYTGFTLGNGKASTVTYDLGMGVPRRFYTAGIQDLNFSFETGTGHLLSRNDALKGLTETFTYDNLGRLLTTKVNGTQQLEMTYDNSGGISMGNIRTKTDAGEYNYGTQKVHAVNYILNPAGATTQPANIPITQQDITYTSFNKAASISDNNYALNITYGASEEKVKSELLLNGSLQERRIYLGTYDKQVIGNTTREIHYVSIGNGQAAIIVRSNGVDNIYYVYVDHLQSVVTVTDASGTIVASQNFDAWGRYRNPSNWQYANVPARPEWLYVGYTSHEQLDKFSIINMSGRMYDPVLGRMVSPDNFVAIPGSTQGFNRYSYANNNPLVFVDKDGNFIHILVGALIGGVVNLASNLIQGNVGSFWQGVGYFGTGLASGAVTAVAGPWAGGAIMGLGNSLTTQISAGGIGNVSLMNTIVATGMGAVTSAAGAGLGNAITPTVSGYLGSIASPVLRNALIQATTGATVGFAIGTGSSLLTGSSFGEALAAGGKNAAFGFTTGAVFGGVTGYKDAVKNHRNPWTGKYEFDVSPVETARATTPDISAGMENKPEEIEYQTVRHHTDPNSLKAIEKSMQINPSRGVPWGVDVEVQPFTELKSVNVGQYGQGAYIEFQVPKGTLPTPPGYMGGTGNVGRIYTNTPLPLKGTNPTFKVWDRWGWNKH